MWRHNCAVQGLISVEEDCVCDWCGQVPLPAGDDLSEEVVIDLGCQHLEIDFDETVGAYACQQCGSVVTDEIAATCMDMADAG